jgi:hypothetical protein
MANSSNTQILRDGYRNFVIRLTGEIDMSGTPADIALTQLTDITTMSPPCLALRVDRVKYSLPHGSPLDVQLWWKATTPILFYGVSGGDDAEFANFGGITNNAGVGKTGDIWWSTSGATGLTAQTGGFLTFAVIVECTKLKVQYPK